ncbi:HU family DNA-binding protein [Pseudomonas syringae pv. pisi]|nr:HU family DNA-binding protein [Pseudomonas syringae pv. pisi]PYD24107.1 HU family DNA-binding protein [Pseudomonas syringae pv. pisi]
MNTWVSFQSAEQPLLGQFSVSDNKLGQIVADQLESGAEITLPGIGKLKVTERLARTGRNPSTGAAIEIAAKKAIKFVPAKVLNDSINKGL